MDAAILASYGLGAAGIAVLAAGWVVAAAVPAGSVATPGAGRDAGRFGCGTIAWYA